MQKDQRLDNENSKNVDHEGVKATRKLRVDIDAVLQSLEHLGTSRPLSIVKTKLEEAKMWAGKHLGELGSELPAAYQDKSTSDDKKSVDTTQ